MNELLQQVFSKVIEVKLFVNFYINQLFDVLATDNGLGLFLILSSIIIPMLLFRWASNQRAKGASWTKLHSQSELTSDVYELFHPIVLGIAFFALTSGMYIVDFELLENLIPYFWLF